MQRCGYKAKLEPDWTSTGPVIHRQKRPMTRLNAGDIPPTTMTVLELFFLSFFSLVVVVQIFSPRVFSSSSSSRGFYFFLRPSLFSFSFVFFFLALFNPPQRHARSSHSRRCWNTHTHTLGRLVGNSEGKGGKPRVISRRGRPEWAWPPARRRSRRRYANQHYDDDGGVCK